jgi:transketolase
VLNPSDEATTQAAVRFAAEHDGPVYLRLTRQKLPSLYNSPSVFQMGRGILVKEGKDFALIGTGSGVNEALKASEELTEFSPWVIDMHTIKPIDRALIRSIGKQCRYMFTVEDHNVVGGLGTAIAEVMAEEGMACKLVRIGVQDTYGESGDPKELYEKYGLSAKRIVQKVRETVK